ncbi:MAG: phytoene/squalene synthase family protein [Candidatus Kapaibacteriales bacterium]
MQKKAFQFDNVRKFVNLYSSELNYFNTDDAYRFCRKVAKSHYENFFIVSPLLKFSFRRYFYAVYTFARLCDDIADEQYNLLTKEEKINYLNLIEQNILNFPNTKKINNPIFLALKDTIEINELPYTPFVRLIEAFRRDVNFVQPRNFEDLEEYCSYSANPIGELVLHLFKVVSQKTLLYSNSICTALQLVNFWQDLSIDIPRGRIYIPQDLLRKYKLTNEDLLKIDKSQVLDLLLEDLFTYTQKLFDDGWKLLFYLSNSLLRQHIQIYVLGGLKIFQKEEKYSSKLFFKRPKLNIFNFINVLLQTLI